MRTMVGRRGGRARALLAAAACAAAAWLPPIAGATTCTWTGNTTSANWSANVAGTTNWSGNVVPVSDASTQLAFNTTANSASPNNDLGAFALYNLTFGGASSFTLGGGALQLSPLAAAVTGISQNSPSAQVVNNNLALLTDATIGGFGIGALTLGGTIDGAANLTISHSVTLNGAVGGTTALAGLSTASAFLTIGGGGITTTGNQQYTPSVTLAANTVLSSTSGGNITLTDGVQGTFALTVNTSGVTTLCSSGSGLGNAQPLTSVTTDAAGSTSIGAGKFTTSGAQTFNDAVTLTNNLGNSSTGSGNITFASTVDGAWSLNPSTSGLTVFGGAVGATTPLSSITTGTSGVTRLSGSSITTTGGQAYKNSVSVGDVTLTSTSSGAISFSGTINGIDSSHSHLTVNTAGITTFGGAVGNNGSPSSITTDAAGSTIIGGSSGGNLITTGAQTYNDPVTLLSSVTIMSSAGGDLTLGGTLDGAVSLSLNTAGTTTFGGVVGGNTRLVGLSANNGGTTVFGSGATAVNTSGNQVFNDAVTLHASVTFTSTGSGSIIFAGGVDGTGAMTVNTAGATTFGGTIGATTAVGSITTDAGGSTTINASSIRTGGSQTYNDAVTLAAATTLNPINGVAKFGSTLDGAFDLTINAGDHAVFAAAVGGVTPLASLTSNAGAGNTLNGGSITTSGLQYYKKQITLGADTTLTSTSGGSITADSTVNGAFALTVGTSGSVALNGAIGGTTALMSLTITNAADVTGGTVTAGSITQSAGTGTTTFTGTLSATGAGGVSLAGNQFSLSAVSVASGPLAITNGGASSISGVVSGTGGLTKGGIGVLTLSAANTYTGTTAVNAGTMTLGAAGSLASTIITVAGGATFNVNGSLPSAAGVVDGGTVNFCGNPTAAVTIRSIGLLSVASSSLATVTPSAFPASPAFLNPNTLTFADTTAKLDLTNNGLVTNEPFTAIQTQVNGGQIYTSTTGGTVGYMDLGSGQVEARFTLLGDSNLDGKVDVTDLGNLASGYGTASGATWVQGDTNHDGAVDVTDLGNLASNYGGALASGPAAMIAATATSVVGATSVPEPCGIAVIVAAAMFGTRRRRQ